MSHIDINVCYLLTSVTFYSHVCSPITTIICTECKYTFVPLAYSAETPCRASFLSRSLNACWGLPASTQRLLEESQVAPCYHRSHTRGCPLEHKTARATSSKSNVASSHRGPQAFRQNVQKMGVFLSVAAHGEAAALHMPFASVMTHAWKCDKLIFGPCEDD